MREQCPQDKVQRLAELIRKEQYQVDPSAVADALIRHVRWEDVPDLAELTDPVRPRRTILRLRGVRRMRRLASWTVRARPQLSH